MSERIYLDHNASTPLDPAVWEAISELHRSGVACGNPSSIHGEGRIARDHLERARARVARWLAAASEEIVFTSSGTEAVALGLIGGARAAVKAGAPPRVLIGSTEHPCVAGAAEVLAAEGFAVGQLAVDREGVLDLDRARAQIAGGAAVVAVALANHEVGTIQPISELVELASGTGALVFCDAVQAAGKLPIEPHALGVDALAVSAHKFYGPKGVGALWLAPSLQVDSVIGSGHQERERRPGTENLSGIVGAGVAAELATERLAADVARAGRHCEEIELWVDRIGGETIGGYSEKVANTTCLRFPGAPAETMVQALDLAGFAVSAGAACTSGKLAPSPVLLAMGYDEAAATEAVRVSTGRATTDADIEALLDALTETSLRVKRFAK